MSDKPVVLFACIHNSGRSVAARVLTEHYAQGAVEARSAGSEPKDSGNPVVAEVLSARGLSTDAEKPTKLDYDVVEAADVVITMGCGETCPVFPGRRYEDWNVDDPAGQDLDTVRRIVDDVDGRVRKLLTDLVVTVEDGSEDLRLLPLGRASGFRRGARQLLAVGRPVRGRPARYQAARNGAG